MGCQSIPGQSGQEAAAASLPLDATFTHAALLTKLHLGHGMGLMAASTGLAEQAGWSRRDGRHMLPCPAATSEPLTCARSLLLLSLLRLCAARSSLGSCGSCCCQLRVQRRPWRLGGIGAAAREAETRRQLAFREAHALLERLGFPHGSVALLQATGRHKQMLPATWPR